MSDCILWAGTVGNHGYGVEYVRSSRYGAKDYRQRVAHRAAWEAERGPIPAGMQVHHTCEVRRCVNVEHMELHDVRHHAGGGAHGVLTQQTADEVRALREAGWLGADVAEAYGISTQQVCNVFKRRCWA